MLDVVLCTDNDNNDYEQLKYIAKACLQLPMDFKVYVIVHAKELGGLLNLLNINSQLHFLTSHHPILKKTEYNQIYEQQVYHKNNRISFVDLTITNNRDFDSLINDWLNTKEN